MFDTNIRDSCLFHHISDQVWYMNTFYWVYNYDHAWYSSKGLFSAHFDQLYGINTLHAEFKFDTNWCYLIFFDMRVSTVGKRSLHLPKNMCINGTLPISVELSHLMIYFTVTYSYISICPNIPGLYHSYAQ